MIPIECVHGVRQRCNSNTKMATRAEVQVRNFCAENSLDVVCNGAVGILKERNWTPSPQNNAGYQCIGAMRFIRALGAVSNNKTATTTGLQAGQKTR